MCGGVHYEEVEGLVSVERWSCSRGASCVMEYIMRRLRDWSALVLPFLATKSAVLSTMSGHCQGEDSASRRGMKRRNNCKHTPYTTPHYRKHYPRNHVLPYSHK